jgi:hypothetical protein
MFRKCFPKSGRMEGYGTAASNMVMWIPYVAIPPGGITGEYDVEQ